jgi:hypothetical protein
MLRFVTTADTEILGGLVPGVTWSPAVVAA